MPSLVPSGSPGSITTATSQGAVKEQINVLVDMMRQIGGNANVIAGALAQADPLSSPFTLYVNPYIGSDKFVGGSYNTFEDGDTDEEIIASKLRRIESQRLECGYTPYRPFKTINRAAIEAAIVTSKDWYTYTDPRAHVDCVSIVLSNGVHVVYSDPGSSSTALASWGTSKIPTISELIAFNPTTGGVLLPRGCSMVGADLRKVSVRPSWTPPVEDELADYSNRRSILKVTGTGYFFGATTMDKVGHTESCHLLDTFHPASKAELDAFYEKIESAVGTGADLGSALLRSRPTEYEIVGPIDLEQNPTSAWDTTAGASPYIFNWSVRSDYGIGGAFWDGDKIEGLKSMVCANFTGVSKQKDMRCWQVYESGNWVSLTNISTDYQKYIDSPPDNVRMNPARLTRHITAVNDAFIQEVSVFGIGQAGMNVTDNGGEITITNSNSTFGGCAAISKGYKRVAFPKDRNWTVGRITAPLNVSAKSGNIRRIYLGTVSAVTSSTITLSSGLGVSGQSTTIPAILLRDGYSFASSTKVWVENPTGPDWQASLTSSAWSSSAPGTINISAQLLESVVEGDTPSTPVGNTAEGVNRAVGKRVYVRRLVDTRLPGERRLSLKLNNTASVRLPQRNFVLQTDPNRSGGAISRVLAGGGDEVLLVTAAGVGPTPGSGVARTSEVTIRRGAANWGAYASGTYYPTGTVVRHSGKHYQAKRSMTSSGASPDPALWGEIFVHMPSAFNPEDSILREAPIIVFDTDTSVSEESTALGIDWTTIWTSAGSARDQYRSGTDYLGAFAFLSALGFSNAAAHAALVPQVAASRDRDPSSATDFPAAPSGGAATGLGNWAVEFRRPSVLRLYGHAWEWAGFGNYSKALPAVQQDMSEFNKFTYYFTNVEGGRVVPQGSNEDGFNVTPRGLEDIETGATIGTDSLDGLGLDDAQRSDFPNGITAGGLSSFQDVAINGSIIAGDTTTAQTNRLGFVGFASTTQIDTESPTSPSSVNNASINAATDRAINLPGLERWRDQRGLLASLRPPATLVVLHVASSSANAITGANSVPFGYETTGHGYDPANGVGLQRLLFNTVSAALDAASRIYVPPGSEVVVSVHNSLTVTEPGPLVIGNGLTPWVAAGARNATTPRILIDRSVTVAASARFPQLSDAVTIFSAGGIFADIQVDVDLNSANNVISTYLTLDGGFGVGRGDLVVRWLNVGNNCEISNATCFYGGKVQIRVYMTATGSDRKVSTVIQGAAGANAPSFRFFDQSGGLLGHGANIIFDFELAGYGAIGTRGLIFEFDHNYASAVPLVFYGLGGRGGCKTGSRTSSQVMWDFAGKQWNLANFISSEFTSNKNYNGISFKTGPLRADSSGGTNLSTSYGISAATAATLAAIQLTRGCTLDMSSESANQSGVFSLLKAVEGKSYSGGTVPATLFTARNYEGSYVYGGASGRNITTP